MLHLLKLSGGTSAVLSILPYQLER